MLSKKSQNINFIHHFSFTCVFIFNVYNGKVSYPGFWSLGG